MVEAMKNSNLGDFHLPWRMGGSMKRPIVWFVLAVGTVLSLGACASSPLIGASYDGNPAKVQRLLAEGANPNEDGSIGGIPASPLSAAVWAQNVQEVQMLLRAGADPNGRGRANPLMTSVVYGGANKTIIGLLLSAGANPNVRNVAGVSLAQLAVRYKHPEVIGFIRSYEARLAVQRQQEHVQAFLLAANSRIEAWRRNTLPLVEEADTYYKKGHFHKAFVAYLRALGSYPSNAPIMFEFNKPLVPYREVLKKLFKAAHKLKSLPPPPESYRKEMVTALYHVKTAKTDKEYGYADTHFIAAIKAAPWEPAPYEAIGHILETLKQYYGSEIFFRTYLLAAPNAPNARVIQDHIYELEAKNTEK